jgi:hypothetical protein
MQRGPKHKTAATASVWEQIMQSRIRRRLRRLGTDHIREVVSDYVAEQSQTASARRREHRSDKR